MRRKIWRISLLAANTGAIVVLAYLFVDFGTAADTSARVRNSLIAEIGNDGDFDWSPESAPVGFQLEDTEPPGKLVEVIDEFLAADDAGTPPNREKSFAIANHLVSNRERGQAIQSDTVTAYEKIVAEGRGYCADYSQVFSGLTITAGIPVREWGMGFEGFGVGHTFNEIFDYSLGKWIFVDSFHSMYVIDALSGVPLSAREFQEALRSGRADQDVRVIPISADKFVFQTQERALAYYFRGADQFYLFWGNSVFSYDKNLLVRTLGSLSRALEVTGAIVSGIHPSIRLVKTDTNAQHLEILSATRNKFLYLFAFLMLACATLLVQLWVYRSQN